MTSKTQTSTSQQTPVDQAGLQNIYGAVSNAAATPYTPYNGQLVAPVNSQQTAGINTINNAATAANPYYAQAGQLASSAANPLTSSEIQQYQNPYTQNVVNATEAQLADVNGQQQQSLMGTAAQQGALGGDRQAVAQSQLAGQQALNEAPTIANLYSNSYTSGLNTAAQQYQQNPLAASSALSGLGTSVANTGLNAGTAQLGAGTVQQQTQQAADTANYGQYQAAQAYPYQSAAYLEQYGLPAALAQGTNGTQTAPGPSVLGQIAGLGVAGAGVATKFAADGGRIEGYYSGGAPGYVDSKFGYIDSPGGYIPAAHPSGSTSLNPVRFASQQQTSSSPFTSAISGLPSMKGSSYGGGNAVTDSYGGSSSNPLTGLDASDYGSGYAIGGLVHAIHSIHKTIRRARGGAVDASSPFQSFDDGGTASFDDRFAPAVDNPFGDLSRNQAINYLSSQNTPTIAPDSIPGGEAPPTAPTDNVINPDNPYRMPDPASVQAWRDGVDQPNPAVAADSGMPDASGTATNPMTNPASLPPQITNPDNTPEQPTSALAYDGQGAPTPLTSQSAAQQQPASTSPFHISDKASNALIAAGLGMLASRSPFAGVAVGEGGLQGLKSYSEETKAEQEAKDKAISQANEQQRIDLQAKSIAQSAANFAKTNALAVKTQAESGEMTDYQKAEVERQKKNDDPAYIKQVAEAKRTANSVLDDDTIHDMADQYLAGDRTVMQNLGRGAQGAENIVKLRQAIAQHARAQGVDPAGIVNRFNEQAGALAGQRTVGARAANISLAANEANNMIPIALAASEKLPRTQYMPWNQMVQSVQRGTSSPELASFVAATNSLVNSYVRAVSPSGVPTDSMREHAYSMLNAAQGPEAYKAVIATMQKEMQAALQAPGQVKEELRKGNAATAAGAPAAPAPPPSAANRPATVIQNGHTYTLQPDGSYK